MSNANGKSAAGNVERIDVAATLSGKNIVVIGSTGFVGKVMLSMILSRYPGLGRIFALVRPGAGATAEDRFFKKVATSPAFDPLRETWGDGFESFLREKVVPISGDIGRPLCNFTDEQFEQFEQAGGLDVIINSAGLVTFTPSLESALRINTLGAKNALEAARKAGAGIVHVSTCFVAGRREGAIWEDEPVVGYFPRKDELRDDDFEAEAEIADCQRLIEEIRARANDRKHISEFRERAAARLVEQRRDPDDEATLRLAVARERKLWVHERLTQLGVERAVHWGWTNTYTYTKSLGEQIVLADKEVPATVVRPAIVESALRFPFPGWNEGFNTTAPLIYMAMKGQRQIVADRTTLDVIPVDMISAGMISAAAAVIKREHEPVYQLGSSDANPVTSARLSELSGLAVRRHYRKLAEDGVNTVENRIRARLEVFPVRREQFDRTSAPRWKRWANRASQLLDERTPTWGAPRVAAFVERAQEELGRVTEFSDRVIELQELFQPFTHDHDVIFRCDNIRALHARLTVADQQALRWDPEVIDWREWWLNTHFEGLQKWVFPVLDGEFGKKPRSVYTYKDLLELFDAATKLHRHRVAMRLLPTDGDAEPVVYTYERVQDMAEQAAAALRQRGVEAGDRVLLMSENRPEWAISYFGILKAGATVVPVDSQLSLGEVGNLIRASAAKVAILSDRVAERLVEDERIEGAEEWHELVSGKLAEDGAAATVVAFAELLSEPAVSPAAVPAKRRGTDVASLIFTSGTTGAPKGVMLSHKNFTSMAAKLSQLFDLYKSDGLLSVLPLHHTFEFSAGLLMPFVHGSQITYLEEVGPDALNDAFSKSNVTAMVGVPALWQLLHRKIHKRLSDASPLIERAFSTVVEANRELRERAPYGAGIGKLLFYPVHRALGGRLRVMISGGSALSPEVMKSFRGLGFDLFEGYGMTEASPVITAQRPGEKPIVGSVGRALPGIDVKIHDPDEHGVGEVIARGPNVMLGYYENEDATSSTIRGGWLHTGDLGRIDEEGNLYVVGRKKEMILGPSGENVYPDELEELYEDSLYVKELSVVGLPSGDGETVAMLVVPDYEADDELSRAEIQEKVQDHIRSVSHKLPLYKRARVVELRDEELPRTATRKVKRNLVVDELVRITGKRGGDAGDVAPGEKGAKDAGWVRDVVARVSQKARQNVRGDTRLDELGFDSLMLTELAAAIEAEGVEVADAGELSNIGTVADLEAYAARHQRPGRVRTELKPVKVRKGGKKDDIDVPPPVVSLGRKTLNFGQRMLYERALDVSITGEAYVPPVGGYIVAANHASHLDMGLVKHALGENGDSLVALAAKDYFFDDPVRRAYFENFTNLVPMERHGSLRESLRLAGTTLKDGYILLIFPEGTRSESGVMIDFKPSLGYLALVNGCGILPMYLAGTHDALPKGAALPRKREVAAHIGPYQSHAALRKMTEGMSRGESYRHIATEMERMVRGLCPREYEWTLGPSGREPATEATVESAEASG